MNKIKYALFFSFLLLLVFGCESLLTTLPSTQKTGALLSTISFSGYEWTTKSTSSLAGPGPNYFSDSIDNLWVDSEGRLHLKITNRDNKWYCPEIYSKDSFGYGKYIFYTASNLDGLDRNAVLGFFTWDEDPAYHNREIDIEFTRWGDASKPNLYYTVQPTSTYSKEAEFGDDNTTHFFNWSANSISFQSIQGHYSEAPSSEALIGDWTYTGADIPAVGSEKMRINLWLIDGSPPSDWQDVEVVIERFEFIATQLSF